MMITPQLFPVTSAPSLDSGGITFMTRQDKCNSPQRVVPATSVTMALSLELQAFSKLQNKHPCTEANHESKETERMVKHCHKRAAGQGGGVLLTARDYPVCSLNLHASDTLAKHTYLDLPTFGRPTMAIVMPERSSVPVRAVRRADSIPSCRDSTCYHIVQ